MNTDYLSHANIISLLGIESLPLDEKKEIVMSAIELVEARTANRIMGMLSEEDRVQFQRFLASGDVVEVGRFLERHGINYFDLMEQETNRVKEELLRVAI